MHAGPSKSVGHADKGLLGWLQRRNRIDDTRNAACRPSVWDPLGLDLLTVHLDGQRS